MKALELMKILESNRDIIDNGAEVILANVPTPKKKGTGLFFTESARYDSTQNILTIFVDKEVPKKDLKYYSDEG